MIYAAPSTSENFYLDGAPTGLVGTLQFRIVPVGSTTPTVGPTILGITEISSGRYRSVATVPATAGDYLPQWINGAVVVDDEILRVTATIPATSGPLVPSLDEVAALERVRIVDAGGNFLPVWTDDTTPSADDVQVWIDKAVRDVRRELGPELETTTDTDLIVEARDLAAIRAAMYVEAGFYPQRLDTEESIYAAYKVLYDEGIARLRSGLRSDPGDVSGFGSVVVASPTNAAYVDSLTVDLWNVS